MTAAKHSHQVFEKSDDSPDVFRKRHDGNSMHASLLKRTTIRALYTIAHISNEASGIHCANRIDESPFVLRSSARVMHACQQTMNSSGKRFKNVFVIELTVSRLLRHLPPSPQPRLPLPRPPCAEPKMTWRTRRRKKDPRSPPSIQEIVERRTDRVKGSATVELFELVAQGGVRANESSSSPRVHHRERVFVVTPQHNQ